MFRICGGSRDLYYYFGELIVRFCFLAASVPFGGPEKTISTRYRINDITSK